MKYALGADGNLDKNRPTEPIAADARPGMDGRINAKLKLVAGILGINYDDLKRRDERRRRRQQRIVVAVSTALVLTFAALAAAAFVQWRMATKETKIANAQTQEAEKQKAEAMTQKAAADTQKAIAQQETVEAENEKEQVETQTAADEEDIAREALLRGDPLTAAQHLSLAYETQPQDAAVRLLLHTAMSGLNGLATVLNGGSGTFTNMEVAPTNGLVLTVTSDGQVQVWNPQKNAPVLIFGKSGNEYNQVHKATFTPDGKGVLLSNDVETYLEDIATGRKAALSAGKGQRFAGLTVSSDGKTVIGSMLNFSADGKTYSTQIAAYSSSDGHQTAQSTISGIYSIVAVLESGARAVLIGRSRYHKSGAPGACGRCRDGQDRCSDFYYLERCCARQFARRPHSDQSRIALAAAGDLFRADRRPGGGTAHQCCHRDPCLVEPFRPLCACGERFQRNRQARRFGTLRPGSRFTFGPTRFGRRQPLIRQRRIWHRSRAMARLQFGICTRAHC